jgi:hypothetical protein
LQLRSAGNRRASLRVECQQAVKNYVAAREAQVMNLMSHIKAEAPLAKTPLTDPEREYADPMALARDSALGRDRKLELLDRWEFTVNGRLAAGDEGMPVTASREGRDSELIRAIGAARKILISN